ncbi:unnamed protein product [Oikopleura dioica]|uniref:Uncharacterized protein n=1 Tax=Oikopleura dioica TaxID=34765 RepID=E4XJJ1_OIKDI|nr:unnamed protein product [Oikopleura dioica]
MESLTPVQSLKKYKLVFLGEQGVGKTSLITRNDLNLILEVIFGQILVKVFNFFNQ